MAQFQRLDAKERLVTQLVALVKDLPDELIAEIADFVGYLQSKHGALNEGQGSPEGILDGLDRYGPLEFDEGELDTLIADIERLRNQDLDDNARLSA
jgi:hypothetical protein